MGAELVYDKAVATIKPPPNKLVMLVSAGAYISESSSFACCVGPQLLIFGILLAVSPFRIVVMRFWPFKPDSISLLP